MKALETGSGRVICAEDSGAPGAWSRGEVGSRWPHLPGFIDSSSSEERCNWRKRGSHTLMCMQVAWDLIPNVRGEA